MRSIRPAFVFAVMAAACGCAPHYTPPEGPLPSNTILLSGMLRELSAQPGFTEALLGQLNHGSKKGPALLTPALVDELRQRIVGKDWSGLDRFPGWTMREINPTVRVAGHFAGKSESLEDLSAVHPGASPAAALDDKQTREFLDLGPYSPDRAETVSLDQPSPLPAFTTEGIVTTLGAGVTRGDGPNPQLAPEHAESQRLADVLNRLAMNAQGSATFTVRVPSGCASSGSAKARLANGTYVGSQHTQCQTNPVASPQQLVQVLAQSGHTVTVIDARYFANFGHLHYKGRDVMMPFWADSGVLIPNSGGRHLLIPVSHAEYEWQIRGPKINADVSYYFGVDGKSEWRTMDTQDQPWVLKRAAHTYTGDQAVEVTRLAGLLTAAYMHLHAAHPALPFGGYYALGVCQDGVSAIEHKLTGKVTLFPNTADAAFFADARDAEVNALIAAIPKDRSGSAPEPERIFGSLPAEPGADGSFSAITIPGLADDLHASYTAWQEGMLPTRASRIRQAAVVGITIAAVLLLLLRRRRVA